MVGWMHACMHVEGVGCGAGVLTASTQHRSAVARVGGHQGQGVRVVANHHCHLASTTHPQSQVVHQHRGKENTASLVQSTEAQSLGFCMTGAKSGCNECMRVQRVSGWWVGERNGEGGAPTGVGRDSGDGAGYEPWCRSVGVWLIGARLHGCTGKCAHQCCGAVIQTVPLGQRQELGIQGGEGLGHGVLCDLCQVVLTPVLPPWCLTDVLHD